MEWLHFVHLQPFATTRMCGESLFRLERRARRLLLDLQLGPVDYAVGWGWYLALPGVSASSKVENVAVRVALIPKVGGEGSRFEIQVAPADKVGQARRFHRDFRQEDLDALRKLDWDVRPNFHLSFMQSHIFYPNCTALLENYFAYWQSNPDRIGRVSRENWESLWSELLETSIVDAEDRPAFDRVLTDTSRDFAVVVPGYLAIKVIDLKEAKKLDDRKVLGQSITKQIQQMASVLKLCFADDGVKPNSQSSAA